MKTNNEKGMTLVEILAALVILGIVFVSFMTIFPQMTNFNDRTETKLETMNLAKQELNELENGYMLLTNQYLIPNNSNKDIKLFRYPIENYENYICEVEYFIKREVKRTSDPNSNFLNKIHIKIIQNDKVISETYGYLKDQDL